MINVGIVDISNANETAGILVSLYQSVGMQVRILDTDTLCNDRGTDLGIHCLKERTHIETGHFDILVVNDWIDDLERLIAPLAWNNILVLNADNRNIYRILPLSKAVLITYGFNGKASVTASSVMDSTVHICLQRGLPTFAGKNLEQQEFSILYRRAEKNIHGLLAAVTAAVVSGLDIDKVKACVIRLVEDE